MRCDHASALIHSETVATKEPKRGRTIPAPAWWLMEARRRRLERGLKQEAIAALVEKHLKVPPGTIDQSRISRCLTGDTTPVELLDAISAVLEMPSPVYVARTLGEAREMNSVQRERDSASRETDDAISRAEEFADRKLGELKAGVAKIPKQGQGAVLRSRRGESKDRRS